MKNLKKGKSVLRCSVCGVTIRESWLKPCYGYYGRILLDDDLRYVGHKWVKYYANNQGFKRKDNK